MSRAPHRSLSRLGVTLTAGTVLALSAIAGAPTAGATPTATDLEGTALRIGGAAITGTTAIPSGRTLTPVRLTTSDPQDPTFAGDGFWLSGAVAAVRTSRYSIPGRPAEEVTFRVDGSVVATSVPDMRFTRLQTDAGPLSVLVFTASGVTYAISTTALEGATRTTASSTVNTSVAQSIVTHAYGLLPVGAQPRVGSAFQQVTNFGIPGGAGVTRLTVIDTDGVRGNAMPVAEEFVARGEPALRYPNRLYVAGEAVVASVTLRSGATVSVRAVRYVETGAYLYVSTTWLFDRAALAAAGATIADVTGVVSQVPASHSLTWQELGFDLA